jgi:hypothetical protein
MKHLAQARESKSWNFVKTISSLKAAQEMSQKELVCTGMLERCVDSICGSVAKLVPPGAMAGRRGS